MKRVLIVLMVSVMLMLVAVPVMAAPAARDTPANDNANNLYLYEKDVDWNIVWDGAWGKLSLKGKGGAFNGHGLEPYTNYELIKYVDPWPGAASVSLGMGESDAGGNVHINADLSTVESGDKIWLVLDADFTGQMVAWNPSEYLFERNLI